MKSASRTCGYDPRRTPSAAYFAEIERRRDLVPDLPKNATVTTAAPAFTGVKNSEIVPLNRV